MSVHTIDQPATDAPGSSKPTESASMRYDKIVRARRDIRAGRYDDDAFVDQLLDQCMGRIAEDAAWA